MNNSRKYAEDLVGALNTGHYDTQRTVANQLHKTNWEDLANQYKNLQENLEMKRQENNRAFAKGLVNTAESGYDQARANAQNLAQRGLNVSGVQNLAEQANTARKGEQVLGLLSNLGNNLEANAEKLKEATSTMAKKEAQLNADLADTLGDIGASQTSAQMNYNAGLAEIAGQKDARDMENEMAKLQREATAAANARSREGNGEIDDKIEEFYKRQAVASILMGVDPETGEAIDWDDKQKANALKILLKVNDADKVVSNYNSNSKLTETNTKKQETHDKELKNLEKEYQKQRALAKEDLEKMYAGKNAYTLNYVKNNEKVQSEIELMLDYLTEGGMSIVEKQDISDVMNQLDNVGNLSFGNNKTTMDQNLRKQIIEENLDALLSDKAYKDNMSGLELYNNLTSNVKPGKKYFSTSFDDLLSQVDTYKSAREDYDTLKKAGAKLKNYKDLDLTFFD